MSLIRRIFFYLIIILLLGIFSLWVVLHSNFFWRWAGGKVVSYAQGRVHGNLQVGAIEGNPFQGFFFKDIVLTTPEEEVFGARSLEIKLSFWSLLELKPVISKVALIKPHLSLAQDEQGQWNISRIYVPSEKPSQLTLPIRSVRFSQILIIDGDVKVTKAGQTQQFKNLDLDLAVNIDDPLTPERSIQVGKVVTAVSSPYGRISLTSRLTYKKNLLDIPLLDLKSGDQTVLSVAGKADLSEGGQVHMQGELALPPKEIHLFWDQWPADWNAGAKFTVQGTPSKMQVSLTGRIQQTSFDVAGTLGQQNDIWNYDLQGNLKDLKPGLLALYDKSLVKKVSQLSPFSVKFHVQGRGLNFPPAQLSWSLEGQGLQYGSAKVDRFNVSLTGDQQKQQFQGSLKGNIGQIDLKAAGSLLGRPDGQFNIKVDGLNPAPLALGAPEGTVINAKLDGKFSAPGVEAVDRVKVTGQIEASGKVGAHPLEKLQVRLAWDKTKLEIFQANVQLGNLMAQLKGTLVGDKLNFSHEGKSASGGNWPIPAEVGGQLSWEGTLKGTLSEPQIALRARGRNLSYESFGVQGVTVNAEGSGAPPSKGRINVQASGVRTPAGVFSQATFQGDGRDRLWNFALRASGPKGVKIDLQGATDLGRLSFSLDRAYVRLQKVTVRNLRPVVVRLSPGIEVEPATFQVNKGRISLQARITGQQVSGSLTVQNLAAEWFAPQSVPLKGKISGQVSLSGQPRSPNIQGKISLEAARYQNVDFQSITTSFNYQGNLLNLSGKLITEKRGPTLTWGGQVPVRLSLMPFSYGLGQGNMQVRVQGDNVNLSMLPSLTTEVEDAKGAVTLQAKIEGTVNRPEISGQVRWGSGFIKLRQTGASYQLQPGEMRLQGNKLTIPQFTLQSEGTATLTSNITLKEFLPDEVRARLQLNNFKAIDKLGSEAFINGAIALDGRWPNLSVQGDLEIPRASFRLSFFHLGGNTVNKDVILVREQAAAKAKAQKGKKPPGEPEVWKNLAVKLDVKAPDNVWVNDRIAKIEASVNIFVRKERGKELTYHGKVRSLEGHVFIVGHEFQVTKGIVDLPEKPGQEPFLDARIAYEMTDVTLYAEASGPVSDFKVTLGGDPAISETDWMSYLLFGKPTGALSQEQYGAVAAETFGGLATRVILQDFLGMSRPFPKGFSVSYQRRTDPLYRNDPYQVVVQYRFNKRFSVQSQVGGRNTGGDVLFNQDF
jgi:translocation and assembly module TamB